MDNIMIKHWALPIRYITIIIFLIHISIVDRCFSLFILLIWTVVFTMFNQHLIINNLLRRLLRFLVFVSMVFLTLLFSGGFSISKSALNIAIIMSLRLLIGFFSLNILFGEGGFLGLINTLQMLSFPKSILTIMFIMNRYIHSFFFQIRKQKWALQSRFLVVKTNLWNFRSWGHILGYTFISAYEKADIVVNAMKSRNFFIERKNIISGKKMHTAIQSSDVLAAFAYLVVCVLVQAI